MGYHKHRCHKCGYVWQHSEAMRGDDDAHTCRHCGEQTWDRYYGDGDEDEMEAVTLNRNNPMVALLLLFRRTTF